MNRAILNVGSTFGDEGKGTTVDFQTRELNSTLTVRFNGGAQAAHNVVLPDGRHHTFAQFPRAATT
jgi:adenylosuccinate synthase